MFFLIYTLISHSQYRLLTACLFINYSFLSNSLLEPPTIILCFILGVFATGDWKAEVKEMKGPETMGSSVGGGVKMSITSKYKNNLKSGGIWAFIGKFFTTFMTLVINAILARMLAAEDVGIYFLAFNFALFGAYIGTIGFEQTVVRFIADNLGKKQLKNVSFMIKMSFIATTIGSALVGGIFFFSSDWITLSVFQSVGFSSISMILIFWMAANSFQILLGETFRGFQDIRFASIFGGVLSTAIFTLTLGGIVYFQWIIIDSAFNYIYHGSFHWPFQMESD